MLSLSFVLSFSYYAVGVFCLKCSIPQELHGQWFHSDNGIDVHTVIDSIAITDLGACYDLKESALNEYKIVFRNIERSCYQCVRFFVRTPNVIEKIEGACVSFPEHEATVQQVCQLIDPHQPMATLFAESYIPVKCRSSLEGVYSFSYQNKQKFDGTCTAPGALINACGNEDAQFDRFNVTYKKCDWINSNLYDEVVDYKCLGDWYNGPNHYFAVANPRESRYAEKFRCFLRNNDENFMGASFGAECKSVRSIEEAPEKFALRRISSCRSFNCSIPIILRGQWFSWENGRNTLTELDTTSMTDRGSCFDIRDRLHVNYTMVFHDKAKNCFRCVKLLVRTVNIIEKMEGSCISLPEHEATVERVCLSLDQHQQLITLFSENYVPVNCRSSLEGVWNFAYQNRFKFTGECRHPDAQIRSCQAAGSQFLITNQKFNITYKKCEGMTGTFDGVVEYSCLGDWFVGKNHYFAVANTKESRKDEKYRCFLKNRDDDLYIGVSITAECNVLKTVEKSPERLHVKPVKSEVVEAGCRLPQNFSGEWINTANIDADIFINETHIIETWYPDEGRYRRTIYVCKEQRDTRVMMARLTVDGCQKDYLCFDFVPQHHNVIRYRRGVAVIKDDFSTVCSWVQFKNQVRWKYDLYLKKNPVPIRCPVAGKFNFTQMGDVPFETRILGGITQSPRPTIKCTLNISDFSVCDEQKEIAIDENHCMSLDNKGLPVDIYSDPDYRMKCIGFWKENLKSYLITYDELDPFSKYRCWVYQRADLNRILMSQAIGPFCDLKQGVDSWNYTEGAVVAIKMEEYERERDSCPMYFDDGSNPWFDPETSIIQFDFGLSSYLRSSSFRHVASVSIVIHVVLVTGVLPFALFYQ